MQHTKFDGGQPICVFKTEGANAQATNICHYTYWGPFVSMITMVFFQNKTKSLPHQECHIQKFDLGDIHALNSEHTRGCTNGWTTEPCYTMSSSRKPLPKSS